MSGTHPHQWSPRRFYTCFPFQSAAAVKYGKEPSRPTRTGLSDSFRSARNSLRRVIGTGLAESATPMKNAIRLAPKSQSIGIENFVTHNGDFEFYKINGKYYDTEAIQQFLVKTLNVPMPATVDSAAIAGMMDLLRVQGCFALSARYAVCFEMDGGGPMDPNVEYPVVWHYEEIGKMFEKALNDMIDEKNIRSLEDISSSDELREELVNKVRSSFLELGSSKTLHHRMESVIYALDDFVSFDIEKGNLGKFVKATVDAFFDNDLLHSMRIFIENAKGSFGLCVTTSMDAHRQVLFAAKGQTLSVAFYPRKGVICYGSEQAAVKAGLNYEIPQGKSMFGTDIECVDENAVRLDLDDLGGEICLLDWGYGGDEEPAVSPPNRNLAVYKVMGGAVNVILLHQENAMNKSSKLHTRLVELENNEFIKPLLDDCDDPVLKDIQDIPRICANIQADWHDVGLNRMTAWHLGQCVKKRMQALVDGTIDSHKNSVDILVIGCEVSLWAAEQFVSDLQKCFPKLGVKAVSSNKLLGLFGQELVMPSIGFPFTQKTLDMKDPIVIIVSHSGGTFAPLACSNLMQSFSSSIFAVTSEWDTQVGKQLRSMHGDKNDVLTSRIFSTEVGVRPAEPCSVSVVATHQLLTKIFEHICVTILSDPHFRSITGSVITERDLQTLERCNLANIKSLERIVGVDHRGYEIQKSMKDTEEELRAAGDIWSEHILENAKAYIMSFVYIVVTVVAGFPLISGIAYAAGLRGDKYPGDQIFYLLRFLDALVYFWLPQINIFILRLFQGRNLRHRMVGRTVVIGDPCSWVAQSAEAFLSKIFACSYSIAGLNVLSGNPADHLVHRHTHRVVRGSLLVCGRPDGRLTALTTLEASTCLAVNQASSIQSIGGTCESITIGHNLSKLPLSFKGIFLETYRPQFLCEKLLDDADDVGNFDLDKSKHKPMQLTSTGNLKADGTSFVDLDRVPTIYEHDDEHGSSVSSSDDEFLESLLHEDSDSSKDQINAHQDTSSNNDDAANSFTDFLEFLHSADTSSDENGNSSAGRDDEDRKNLEPKRKQPRENGWSKLRTSITRRMTSSDEDDLNSSFFSTESERNNDRPRPRGGTIKKASNAEDNDMGNILFSKESQEANQRRPSRRQRSQLKNSLTRISITKPRSSLDEELNISFISTESETRSEQTRSQSPGEDDDLGNSFVSKQSQDYNRRRPARRQQNQLKNSLTRITLRKGSSLSSDQDEPKGRSSASLLGEYSNMEKEAREKATSKGAHGDHHHLDTVINDMIKERKGHDRMVEIFHEFDTNNNGFIEFREFVVAYKKINPDVSIVQLQAMFEEADMDGNGSLDLNEFVQMTKMPHVDVLGKLSVVNRDARGLVQVMPSAERYFGEELEKNATKGVGAFIMSQSQHLSMELYESRIASVERFVAMTVMFHQMGMRVQSFFPRISFGFLGYRMDRTHSIMRIATTASPVSGADVRDRMLELHLRFKIQKAVNLVARKYMQWRKRQVVTSTPEVIGPTTHDKLLKEGCMNRRKSL